MLKKIKILTQGILPGKSFIYGPVLTPYYETDVVIFQLLSKGVEIVEVIEDDAEVKLTISNYLSDNTKAGELKRLQKERAANEAKLEAEKAKKAKKNTKREAGVTKAVETTEDTTTNNNKSYYNNKNKKKFKYEKPATGSTIEEVVPDKDITFSGTIDDSVEK